MERFAFSPVLMITACLSLWAAALQVTLSSAPMSRPLISTEHSEAAEAAASSFFSLISNAEGVQEGLLGESLREDGTPIIAAAAGHWF